MNEKNFLKRIEEILRAQFKLRTKEFWSCNALKVTVGTNTPCGGDAGHGGKTLFKLNNLAGTCWSISVNGKEFREILESLTIVLSGDTEAETFADSLIFAGKTLKKQIRETEWNELHSRVVTLEHRLETKEEAHEE